MIGKLAIMLCAGHIRHLDNRNVITIAEMRKVIIDIEIGVFLENPSDIDRVDKPHNIVACARQENIRKGAANEIIIPAARAQSQGFYIAHNHLIGIIQNAWVRRISDNLGDQTFARHRINKNVAGHRVVLIGADNHAAQPRAKAFKPHGFCHVHVNRRSHVRQVSDEKVTDVDIGPQVQATVHIEVVATVEEFTATRVAGAAVVVIDHHIRAITAQYIGHVAGYNGLVELTVVTVRIAIAHLLRGRRMKQPAILFIQR